MTADTRTDPAAIEADIIRQREELARTVDALSAKVDVKARAEHKVADLGLHGSEAIFIGEMLGSVIKGVAGRGRPLRMERARHPRHAESRRRAAW